MTRSMQLDRPGDELGGQGDDDGEGEDAGQDDEEDAGVAAGQKAEGGAVVVDVHKTDNAGDKGLAAGLPGNIAGNPVLDGLVKDDDQNTKNRVKHNFLLSAADRTTAWISLFTASLRPRRSGGRGRSQDRPGWNASSSAGTWCRALP